MKEKAVLGVIGCGSIAQAQHLINLEKNPRIRVKWCCDLAEENLQFAHKNYTVENLTSNYFDILNDKEVDGVLILTPHDKRVEIIKDAAFAGKHIYVEKPMSVSSLESYQIVKIIRESGVKLVVGLNRRCAPATRDAVGILKKHRQNPTSPSWRYIRDKEKYKPLREQESTMVLMRINDDIASFKSYAIDEYVGGGSLIGELCHFIDLACLIIGKEPIKIYAEGWARVNQSLTILFEDLSIATIFETGSGTFDHPKELIEVYHNGLSMQIDHFMQLRVAGIEGAEDREYPLQIDPCPEVVEGKGCELFISKSKERNRRVMKGETLPFIMPNKGHYEMLDQFVDCILLDAPSPCNELDGARATLVARKGIESVRSGLPMKICRDEYDFFIS